jgi:hypothetical protein
MTGTHRGLNRFLLALTGLLLIAAGTLTASARTVPGLAGHLAATGRAGWDRIRAALASAPLPDGNTSWWTIAAIGVLLLGAALLISWAASQGRRPHPSCGGEAGHRPGNHHRGNGPGIPAGH